MTAIIIPIDDAWFHRLRRDVLAHGQRESARQFIAGTDRMLDDMGRAQDRAIVLQREERTRPCDTEEPS